VTTERRKSLRIEPRRFAPCCRIIGAVIALVALIVLGTAFGSFQTKL
jgi:hypothetical protein